MAQAAFWKADWFIGLSVLLMLLLVGLVLLAARRLGKMGGNKEKQPAESAEAKRMLGLAFQGQGQLDQAFDKFRECPMSEGLMENIYNLALDYERQRQFKKSETVFRYLSAHNPIFRDLPARLGPKVDGEVAINTHEPVEKPMLGHYVLEKELGKGAMGVVYLGRDSQNNRLAAIKTMALAQAFDVDELVEVKQRFFREAETVARLDHPNIVSIYDAGEANGLAYIAMAFLPGGDLVSQTKPAGLLPLTTVLSIIARVADALDYAHAQHVVHRDIKPANIMYEPLTDQVKVTDFGIARITDSSRTKAGMVLGTPAYMSPEQITGKKIDGRSDLYSLGVMLYQMCCGQPPFSGDSLARLMFKITSEAPTDILSINPALPAELVAVINKSLSKTVEGRYQRGATLAAALRACQEKLPTAVAGLPKTEKVTT